MYHETSIQKLSPTQISKLLNGHRIRVKHGAHHKVHLSQEQNKKLHTAHRKGCGITMQFDPYQIHHHQHLREHCGGGPFSDMVKKVAKVALKEGGKKLIDVGGEYAKNQLEEHVGSGARRSVKRKGKGIHFNARKILHTVQDIAPIAMELAPLALGAGFKRKTPKKGKGVHWNSRKVLNTIHDITPIVKELSPLGGLAMGSSIRNRGGYIKHHGHSGYDSEEGGALFAAGY